MEHCLESLDREIFSDLCEMFLVSRVRRFGESCEMF